jgi:hypothetical protein
LQIDGEGAAWAFHPYFMVFLSLLVMIFDGWPAF